MCRNARFFSERRINMEMGKLLIEEDDSDGDIVPVT